MGWFQRRSRPRLSARPAGTGDRPPLQITELDPRAWAALCWRQEHLPLDRLRRTSDWWALNSLERRAVFKVADRLGLDDDQRYSLMARHGAEVERRAAQGAPEVVETREQLIDRFKREGPPRPGAFELWWQRNMPSWWVGWPTWFKNRGVGVRDKRFRLATRRYYTGAPGPTR